MAIALFVSEQYVKQYTPIGGLVEWSEIEPSLHLAQDSYIQDILGSNFYVYLQEQYRDQLLNPDEITLVSLIKPALAHRVAEQLLPFLHAQLKNKGAMTQSGDYAQPVDLETLKYLRNELSNRSEFYSVRLSRFLCAERALFPQYTQDNDFDMKPHQATYDGCDLYLEGGCC
jgi:hypothetical protein